MLSGHALENIDLLFDLQVKMNWVVGMVVDFSYNMMVVNICMLEWTRTSSFCVWDSLGFSNSCSHYIISSCAKTESDDVSSNSHSTKLLFNYALSSKQTIKANLLDGKIHHLYQSTVSPTFYFCTSPVQRHLPRIIHSLAKYHFVSYNLNWLMHKIV